MLAIRALGYTCARLYERWAYERFEWDLAMFEVTMSSNGQRLAKGKISLARPREITFVRCQRVPGTESGWLCAQFRSLSVGTATVAIANSVRTVFVTSSVPTSHPRLPKVAIYPSGKESSLR